MKLDTSSWNRVNKRIVFTYTHPYKADYDFIKKFTDRIEIDQANFFFSTSKIGGTHAMLYKQIDGEKISMVGFNEILRSVYVYSPAGSMISHFEVDRTPDCPVIGLHFVDSTSNIALVYADGTLVFYTQLGIKIKTIRALLKPGEQQFIIKYCFDMDAFACIYNDGSLIYLESIHEFLFSPKNPRIRQTDIQKCRQLYSNWPPSSQELKCFSFIPSKFSEEGIAYCAIINTNTANDEKFITLLDPKDVSTLQYFNLIQGVEYEQNYQLSSTAAEFDQVKLHADGNLLLLANTELEPTLCVIDISAYKQNYVNKPKVVIVHNTQSNEMLFDFCGILPAYYNKFLETLSLVVPTKSGTRVAEIYQGPICWLQSEGEGLSMVGLDQKGFVRVLQVGRELQGIYGTDIQFISEVKTEEDRVNNCIYGAQQLLIAYNYYKVATNAQTNAERQQITQSDHLLRAAAPLLAEAVKVLIKAAAVCYDVDAVLELLEAICYAKLYAPCQFQHELTQLYDAARQRIRVRNDLRESFQLSVAPNYFETQQALANIVNVICAKQNFGGAIKLFKFCQLDQEDLLKSVLLQQVIIEIFDVKNNKLSEKDLFSKIDTQLQQSGVCSGVYRAAAEFLVKGKMVDRPKLVAELIEKEPCVKDQVQLYLELEEYDKAIKKAYNTYSEDLVLSSLTRAVESFRGDDLGITKFLRTLLTIQPGESDIFIRYIKNLIQQTILENYKNMELMPELAKYCTGFFYKIESLDLLSDAALDPMVKQLKPYYRYELAQGLERTNQRHQSMIEVMQSVEIQDKQIILLGFQLSTFVSGSKIVKQFNNQAIMSPLYIARQYGLESVKFFLAQQMNAQAVSTLDIGNSEILKDYKHFWSTCKKHDVLEEQCFLNVALGIVEGVAGAIAKNTGTNNEVLIRTGLSLLEDWVKNSPSKGALQKSAGPILQYMGQILPVGFAARSTLTSFMVQVADKYYLLRGAVLAKNVEYLKVGIDGTDDKRNLIWALCFKSVSKELQTLIHTQ